MLADVEYTQITEQALLFDAAKHSVIMADFSAIGN
jgi:hypothetical protein